MVANYPKSRQADDAQLEIGKALLALNRLDEARTELLQVAEKYPGSPLADDALYLIGQSYERQAQQLAAVTVEKAREEAFERGQRGAYPSFNEQLQAQERQFAARRDMLRREGKKDELGPRRGVPGLPLRKREPRHAQRHRPRRRHSGRDGKRTASGQPPGPHQRGLSPGGGDVQQGGERLSARRQDRRGAVADRSDLTRRSSRTARRPCKRIRRS